MSEKGWPVAESFGGLLQQMSKEMSQQERRPAPPTAASLLGPGIAPFAKQLLDWNSSAAYFNGFWFSEDALNQPSAGSFLGISIGAAAGHVTQIATRHDHAPADPNLIYVRRLHRHSGQAMVVTAWELISSPLPAHATLFIPSGDSLPAGWGGAPTVAAPAGLRAITLT